MRWPAILAVAAFPAAAETAGLDMAREERAAFGQEVRAAVLSDLTPIDRALNPPPIDLYGQNREADLKRLEDSEAVFAPTPRGIGADDPRLTILFFESFPCTDCSAAWADLEALIAAHPDVRVEPRFAEAGGPAQLLLSLLDHQGPATYHAARMALHALPDTTPDSLAALSGDKGWVQDRMLRLAPRREAEAFARLDLDTTPSYVFPDMMLRGSIPLIVLEKYVK